MYKQEGKTMLLLEKVKQLRIELTWKKPWMKSWLKWSQEKSLLVRRRYLAAFYSSFTYTDFVPYSARHGWVTIGKSPKIKFWNTATSFVNLRLWITISKPMPVQAQSAHASFLLQTSLWRLSTSENQAREVTTEQAVYTLALPSQCVGSPTLLLIFIAIK